MILQHIVIVVKRSTRCSIKKGEPRNRESLINKFVKLAAAQFMSRHLQVILNPGPVDLEFWDPISDQGPRDPRSIRDHRILCHPGGQGILGWIQDPVILIPVEISGNFAAAILQR